jgi:hypothetical protein
MQEIDLATVKMTNRYGELSGIIRSGERQDWLIESILRRLKDQS